MPLAHAPLQTAADLSLDRGADRIDAQFANMQRGLVYPSPYAIFATFWRRTDDPHAERITRTKVGQVWRHLRQWAHEHCGKQHASAIVGVNLNLWLAWCAAEGRPAPGGMGYEHPEVLDGHLTSAVFGRSGGVFQDSRGDLWFNLKADTQTAVEQLFAELKRLLVDDWQMVGDNYVAQFANSRPTPTEPNGKVLGRRFSENLNNPADPISVSQHALVGYEDWKHLGASFVLTQRFSIAWDQLHAMSETQVEDVIGRTSQDTILPTRDTRSHIKSARRQDEHGNTTFILRLGLPFGRSPFLGNQELALKGSNRGDEAGNYFAGFAKSARVLEGVLNQMVGQVPGFIRDRLFNNARADIGGIFYIPCLSDLLQPAIRLAPRAKRNWRRFPGVDWSRLSRHFTQASPNGRMFYNHKDYLYRMATNGDGQPLHVKPPSTRILQLLAVSFSRWQDNWYFDRKQEEMGSLAEHVAAAFGEAEAERVMALPIAERKGWADRMTLRLSASAPYGIRGSWEDEHGNRRNGADTYRIHPLEHIVGGMPNLSLSQGRYVMTYLNDTERKQAFFDNLSEASGVGHVVPGIEKALTHGIDGLLAQVYAALDATTDSKTQSFYRGVLQALTGISEWSLRHAELAESLAAQQAEGQAAERANLLAIAARMRHLAHHPPRTFIEATQLVYTIHCCLHLCGEPTSIGRLDQMLYPYLERQMTEGTLCEGLAQEIIDALWVKLDEKVQQNRMFVEEHQPFGNLAMGGGSGPYPKGGATNQWIQQVTVGGTIANDDPESQPAHNLVTRLALRASGRLPLNAPCLSLRVRHDTPTDLLQEAAEALLSGGAHPILLNDDKLIPGLVASGEDIGGPAQDPNSVTARANGKWASAVTLRSARNYACDGCYEPQFPGENWFSLGGFSALDPLECALNQGKTYSSAGPGWYRGAVLSFTSAPASALTSFEQVVDLYLQHFQWLFSKAMNGQLHGFGANTAVCPSPILSALVDDCIAKGLDYYSGGARYNIYGPCFFALPSAINSLWAIRALVYDPETAVTSLPELVEALICDWGHKMVEPFQSSLAGPIRSEARARRFQQLREAALAVSKYGRGHADVDAFGDQILQAVAQLTVDVFRAPIDRTADQLVSLAQTYGTDAHPFGIQVQPGVGNFENFVENGQTNGASADGRRLGETISSDLSATPSPADRAPEPQNARFADALGSFTGAGTDAMWDAAPTDFNIAEDFPLADLTGLLAAFAKGRGSNLLTVTCASQSTFADAPQEPEKYDLVRVRMGGWTEFFTSMFPDKQEQHQRRPRSTR